MEIAIDFVLVALASEGIFRMSNDRKIMWGNLKPGFRILDKKIPGDVQITIS